MVGVTWGPEVTAHQRSQIVQETQEPESVGSNPLLAK